jgi:hypothetical protein
MPKYVHVGPEWEDWLRKAIEFVKRNEGSFVAGTVGPVIAYLLQNNIPHGTKDSVDQIPKGHHYHG